MSTRAILAAVIICGSIAVVSLVTPNSTAQVQSDGTSEKIRDLLRQKVDILKQRVQFFEEIKYHQKDRAPSLEDTISARIDLLEAKLLLALEKSDRIALLKDRIHQYKELETAIEESRMMAAAKGELYDKAYSRKFLASARRLDAEIDLLREESLSR